MKLGILGTGSIGKPQVMGLSQAWREVKGDSSRSPDTFDAEPLSSGAFAIGTEETLADVDVVVR
jgi:hypothetical protein